MTIISNFEIVLVNSTSCFIYKLIKILKASIHLQILCCGNHLSQGQMILLMSKSLSRVIMWEFHKRT